MKTAIFLVVAIVAVGAAGITTAILSTVPTVNAKGLFECTPNPHGKACGDPHDLELAGAPPTPKCDHKNSFKNSQTCRG
jgi:hypothetical protein